MLKSILGLLVSLGFAASASAAYEIQINGSYGSAGAALGMGAGSGTSADISMIDDGNDSETSIGLVGEVYYGLNDNLQVGGLLGYSKFGDLKGMGLGALVRYNLNPELRDSMFVGGGLRYMTMDAGPADADNIALLLSAGKRYAISDTITWTPNISLALNIAGDVDEGHVLSLNILSFSGFMD